MKASSYTSNPEAKHTAKQQMLKENHKNQTEKHMNSRLGNNSPEETGA
jgi:hypothetical protein